jgi:hypothetical protein
MIRCKNCGSMMYEDDVWHDVYLGMKMQDVACFHCSNRKSIKLSDWLDFKKKLQSAIIKLNKNENSKNIKK